MCCGIIDPALILPTHFSRMQPIRALFGSVVLLLAGAAKAQAPFPPTSLTAAPSFEAATAAIGATKPEFSSYLLLDVPEISTEGLIHAVVKSELPGTTHLILIRQFPVGSDRKSPAADNRQRNTTAQRPTAGRAPMPQPKPPTVFIAARQIKPGEPARLDAKFQFNRNERFTLLAFAQGRWFGAAREIKLAREVSDRP